MDADENPAMTDGPEPSAASPDAPPVQESEQALVKRVMREIKLDKEHHKKAFERMRQSMFLAMNGRTKDWGEKNYSANIIGRHINQTVSALYAKNPKAVARRRETLDFRIWDENPQAIIMAQQTIQSAQLLMQQTSALSSMTGQTAPTVIPPGYQEATALIQDFQQGVARREEIGRIGKTLEILFAQALREQQPVDFKTSMKQFVRRAKTTGVAYLMYDFQRVMGERPPLVLARVQDAETRLARLNDLVQEAQEGELEETSAEAEELRLMLDQLNAEPLPVASEGLVFDFPASTDVIPDRLTKNLVGFLGARHVTVQHLFTKDRVHQLFPSFEPGSRYTPYSVEGEKTGEARLDETCNAHGEAQEKDGLVRVYAFFDRVSGLVYWVADGYDRLLRPAGPPGVTVKNFFPIEALTFNEVESEKELFPPSDVELLKPMQEEYNFSRQGKRDHRRAAKPRWATGVGALEQADQDRLVSANAFDVVSLNGLGDGQKINDILQVVPVPGVDPNLYDTGELFTDMQLVAGTSEAQLGGVSKATATEAGIAASSSASSINSNIDDLDSFLTRVARNSGQIMMTQMSPEYVSRVAGPGALWPELTLQQIQDDLFLEVEAGSTGAPNQAIEIHNWKSMLPFLLQMPGIRPEWLAMETLRRLGDRMDLTGALVSGLPAIIAQNQNAQPMAANGQDPAAQGGQGADNASRPADSAGGSDAAFGSNQV